ncbi:MAG: hypothetical protein PF689_04155 [Deltaproteobacteria bacterium]|jgi:hypothetical protein|nr:hypothetical protein [Deltaproteobacteria bacterium]
MFSLPLILTVNTVLFFLSLLGAYHFQSDTWILFLYPLGFSLGCYLLVIFNKIAIRGKLDKIPVSTFITAIAGIMLYFLLSKFFPPLTPPAPDPFVPDPPKPVDWHTIGTITIPLSFWIYAFLQGVNYFVKTLKAAKTKLTSNLLTILSIMLSLYGFNIIIPIKETLLILIIDLFLTFSVAWVSYLVQNKKESGGIVRN